MRRAPTILLLAALAVGTVESARLWLLGYRPEPEHGALLAEADGVPIYYHRAGHDLRGKYGLEFECVEFANRWLVARGRKNLTRSGHALSYFESAKAKGLRPFPNGGEIPPSPGDLIVFRSSTQPYGHIGVVLKVEDSAVTVAQQNASAKILGGLLVKPLPIEHFPSRSANGFTVLPRWPLTCIGWVRPAP